MIPLYCRNHSESMIFGFLTIFYIDIDVQIFFQLKNFHFKKSFWKIEKYVFEKKCRKYFTLEKSIKLIFQKINFIDFSNVKYFFDIFFQKIFFDFSKWFFGTNIFELKKNLNINIDVKNCQESKNHTFRMIPAV